MARQRINFEIYRARFVPRAPAHDSVSTDIGVSPGCSRFQKVILKGHGFSRAIRKPQSTRI